MNGADVVEVLVQDEEVLSKNTTDGMVETAINPSGNDNPSGDGGLGELNSVDPGVYKSTIDYLIHVDGLDFPGFMGNNDRSPRLDIELHQMTQIAHNVLVSIIVEL